MSISVDEYRKIKKKVDELRSKADRAQGEYEASLRRLSELGYNTIAAAKEGLEDLRAKEHAAIEAYEKELESFKAKWGDLL